MRLLLSVIFCTVSSSAFALTLKETKIVKDWNATMAASNKLVKEKCGKEIKASMDEASWVKEIPKWLGRSMVQSCEDTMDTIATMCADADAKAAILKKIDSLKCFAGKDDAELKFEFVKGMLKITNGINGYYQSKAKEFLENNL
jgi:Golgi nucleoside diphosphatase